MSNIYYSHSSAIPVAQTRGFSAIVRAEFDLIAAGFDSVAQLQMGLAVESGTLNNFLIATSPALAAYPTKGTVVFIATHANSGAATLQIGALATIPLLANDGTALTSNYIKSGELCMVYITTTAAYMLSATKSYVDGVSLTASLPAQGGNAGKFIITDGTTASWGSTVTVIGTGNGAVGAPAITMGDAPTGWYRSALNQIAAAINGSLGFLIDASKNVTFYANLIISGVAARITGDFSNATHASRVMAQSSTVNGSTFVGAVANGTSQTAGFAAYGGNDPSNAPLALVQVVAGTEVAVYATKTGTGAFLPLRLYTSDVQRMQIDAAGVLTLAAPLPVAAGGTGSTTAGSEIVRLTTVATVAFSATPTFDGGASYDQIFGDLTANVTAVTLSNMTTSAREICIKVQQDATGGRTWTHPTGAKGAGAIGSLANQVSYIVYKYNASKTRADFNISVMGT